MLLPSEYLLEAPFSAQWHIRVETPIALHSVAVTHVASHSLGRCPSTWWELKGGGRRMRGNWGMNSWKIVVYARCAGSLQVGLLERKVHATTARQRALQHWDFGTPRINFSSDIQTKGFQQRPPPQKSLKLASCQTRPVASLFWQLFCGYPKCIFLGG